MPSAPIKAWKSSQFFNLGGNLLLSAVGHGSEGVIPAHTRHTLQNREPFNVAQRHVQNHPKTGGRISETRYARQEKPINVAHTITAHLGQSDFNATLLTDDTTMLEAFVLAAEAFVILDGAKILAYRTDHHVPANVR